MSIQIKPNEALRQARRLPVGAELLNKGEAHFRVWAPVAKTVEVVLDDDRIVPLQREEHGYHSGHAAAAAGTRYRYRLNGDAPYPDPVSRFQPQGPHGPSQIVDPNAFSWTDGKWTGVPLDRVVLYEMHIGTFTRQGTWRAAAEQLNELAALGITLLEVMPVAEFPGRFGWGYDGVNFFAPTRLYGEPDDFRFFVDRAHSLGVGVILDVVYNHFGPDGNYLKRFAPDYFTDRYQNEWGEAINFDGPNCQPVREFFLANARYWIDEFHLDGLRLDATQQIFDESSEPIVREVAKAVRAAAQGRITYVVAENETQVTDLVRPIEAGGSGFDGVWNDDFHHTAMVTLTGKKSAYYSDYNGTPQELLSAMKWGFLYQGQRYAWQKRRRGTPGLDVPPARFVTFLQNHDQVANSGRGLPLPALTSPGRLRAMTAYWLLGPGTPMLFQGQEFGSARPFLYFAEHKPDLAKLVAVGRHKFLTQFPELGLPATAALLADPADPATFEQCRLDFGDRVKNAGLYQMHRDLLTLRRMDPVFRAIKPRGFDGAILDEQAFVMRYFGDGEDRLVVVNCGRDLTLESCPEPLLAPRYKKKWSLLWTSDDVAYGGYGTREPETDLGWFLPGEATIVLQ